MYSVAFSPDGNSILTGSQDGTAKLLLIPSAFLKQKVHRFTLQQLYDAGVQLQADDLKQVEQKK
ncbi:MAG: WD40 repeat domain-containing protein [Bacteroidota bacterium]